MADDKKPSENAAKLRAVTLAIARTPVKFKAYGVMEMFEDMARSALDNTKGANDIEDVWSREYDELIEKRQEAIEAQRQAARRGYR